MSARLQLQVDALLARVAADAEARREALRGAAEAEIDAIRTQARSAAHARVRSAAAEKRRRVAERCRLAVAATESAARAAAFEHEHERLQAGRAALAAALAARWAEAATRERWWRAALALAARRLLAREWRVETTALDPSEASALQACAEQLGARLELCVVPEIRAGLRVSAGRACVDATPDGLLADAAAIDAQLLAALGEPA